MQTGISPYTSAMSWSLFLMVFSCILLSLVALLLGRALLLRRRDPLSLGTKPETPPDSEALISRFQRAIAIPTMSHSEYSRNDEDRFAEFQDFLQWEFADLLADCEIERFGVYGITIRWPARGVSEYLPLLYTAHYDVVPVEGQEWTYPPFEARRAEGYVWGRGTLDTKNSLMALLEAAARLHADGFVPSRDIWFAFAGDEETSSLRGARTMARWFEERGIRFAWVFDEGGIIAENMVPGVRGNAALVGVAEKGYANILLEAEDSGGHSSSPGSRTALGRVSRAVDRLERGPRPSSIPPTMKRFFIRSAPYMGFGLKLVMANLWLFAPLVKIILSQKDSTRAMLHSTIAPTMAGASDVENILPTRAWAVINVRLAPGEQIPLMLTRFRRIIADESVRVSLQNEDDANEAVVPPQGGGTDAFLHSVERALGDSTPLLAALPYLMTGATDSKYYAHLADEVYRFVPMLLNSRELELLHAPDERISEANYFRMVGFYARHLQHAAGAPGENTGVSQ